MSPPHNLATIERPRTLAHVLADLKEARRDWQQAISDYNRAEEDSAEEQEIADRMGEADTRMEDLRDEFDRRFLAATGLTFKQIEAAISEAVL